MLQCRYKTMWSFLCQKSYGTIKKNVQIWKIMIFMASVMNLDWWYYLSLYVLLYTPYLQNLRPCFFFSLLCYILEICSHVAQMACFQMNPKMTLSSFRDDRPVGHPPELGGAGTQTQGFWYGSPVFSPWDTVKYLCCVLYKRECDSECVHVSVTGRQWILSFRPVWDT